MRLEPRDFIRRFLQHVLPSRFTKIRYFALHHSSKRPLLKSLQAAMALQLGRPLPAPPPTEDPCVPACPACNQPMRFQQRIAPGPHAIGFSKTAPTRGPP